MRGNLADVSAKENAQETAVTLGGLLLGSLVAKHAGDSPQVAWLAFVLLTLVHIWANWLGVGCLAFTTLNPQRAVLLTRAWWEAHDANGRGDHEGSHVATSSPRHRTTTAADAPTPTAIASRERLWRPMTLWLFGPRLGVGVRRLVDTRTADGGASQLRELESIFARSGYLLREGGGGGGVHVALRPRADGACVLKALLHCALLRHTRATAAAASPEKRLEQQQQQQQQQGGGGLPRGLPAGERAALEESLRQCEDA